MPSAIKCEVLDVRTDTGVCPGVARTRRSESYVLAGRTPGGEGVCSQALCAMNSMRLAMAVTAPGSQVPDPVDIVCPHGYVTFRLTRT